jgi:hypothetical protein
MRYVLIVSPNFPPADTADSHRVRLSLPYYRAFGWEPTVLCVDPAFSEAPQDSQLLASLPGDLAVCRVPAWPLHRCRRLGFGQLSYRSLLPLYRAGCELLRRRRCDVVFFSTTVFLALTLGPLWRRRFGCRIVYDFHDPWYDGLPPYDRENAPGGWRKYRADRYFARHAERFAMTAPDHVIAVSEGIIEGLRRRYPRLSQDHCSVVPFPSSPCDYDPARLSKAGNRELAAPDGKRHWVYAGAYTPAMTPVLDALFGVLKELRRQRPGALAGLRLHFVGTSYAPAEQAQARVMPLALAQGVADLVEETPHRIPYTDALSLYSRSDAILLIGSVDPAYTASKLLTCVLAKKPTLALFHRKSLVSNIAAGFPNVFLAAFGATPDEPGFRDRVAAGLAWLLTSPAVDPAAVDTGLAPWSAQALTERQCRVFDQVAAVANARPAQAALQPGAVR